MNLLHSSRNRKRFTKPSYRPRLDELESRLLMATNVLTYHNDTGLTGQDLTERPADAGQRQCHRFR